MENKIRNIVERVSRVKFSIKTKYIRKFETYPVKAWTVSEHMSGVGAITTIG